MTTLLDDHLPHSALTLPRTGVSRSHQIGDRLTQLARQLGPDARLPPMVELRRLMGVSMTALAGALGDLEAQGVLVRRNGVGVFTAPRVEAAAPWRVTLLCTPNFFRAGHSPFWDMMVEQIHNRAHEDNGEVELHFLQGQGTATRKRGMEALQESLRRDLAAGRHAGVLAIGADASTLTWIEQQGVPVVSFAGGGRYRVGQTNTDVAYLGARTLAERGCRRIGLWQLAIQEQKKTRPEALIVGRENQREMFFRGLREGGATPLPELVHSPEWQPSSSSLLTLSHQEQGWDAAMRFFDGDLPRPDALVITDDFMTRGALAVLERMGIEVGHDVQIATHSNRGSALLEPYHDRLIRLEFDPAEVVDLMFQTLQQLWAGLAVQQGTQQISARLILPSGESAAT